MTRKVLFQGDSDEQHQAGFLIAADRIGAEFVRNAIWSGDQCTWLGWTMKPVGGTFLPAFGACSATFYDGLPGIALFLAYLVRETGDTYQKQAMHGALRNVLAQAPAITSPGYYSGLGGIGHTLVKVGELTGNEQYVEKGIALLRQAAQSSLASKDWDLLSGAAGLIPALLDVAARCGSADLVDLAKEHGQRLVHAAVPSVAGVSWPSPDGTFANLLGYSHGTSGIALSLLELFAVTGSERYRATALGALAYERHYYSATDQNWPDFRVQPGNSMTTRMYPVAWCHGAGGIGIMRLRAMELMEPLPELTAEVDAALQCVSRQLANSHSAAPTDVTYCHGTAGLADFLLECSLQFDRPDIRQATSVIGQSFADRFGSTGLPWPCGTGAGGGESPGLMLGVAGIGYSFLRFHDAVKHPSVLLVRPSSRPG
jgi:lantibiotic biosynthesis protein